LHNIYITHTTVVDEHAGTAFRIQAKKARNYSEEVVHHAKEEKDIIHCLTSNCKATVTIKTKTHEFGKK